MAIKTIEALWFALPIMKGAVAFFLFRRKLHLRFPLFFTSVMYGAIASVLLYAVGHWASYKTYFYSYWTSQSLLAMLSLAVVYEIFMAMFRQHHGLRDFGSVLFRWAGVVSILMAITLVSTNPGYDPHRVVNFILGFERAMGIVQCGLLLLLILFAEPLGISWKHQLFGIVFGLGSYSCIRFILVAQWARSLFGATGFNLLDMVAYLFTLVIWLVYALMPQPAESLPNLLLRPQRWSDALIHAANPMPEQTVLLGIEDIVDRALM